MALVGVEFRNKERLGLNEQCKIQLLLFTLIFFVFLFHSILYYWLKMRGLRYVHLLLDSVSFFTNGSFFVNFLTLYTIQYTYMYSRRYVTFVILHQIFTFFIYFGIFRWKFLQTFSRLFSNHVIIIVVKVLFFHFLFSKSKYTFVCVPY